KMLRKKNIVLNGKKADGNELIKATDEIQIFFSDETFDKFAGDDIGGNPNQNVTKNSGVENENSGDRLHLIKDNLLFEDENIIVVNKPENVLSQKAGRDDISLTEIANEYLREKNEISSGFKAGVCNRLDRNTSGIVVIGKSMKGLHLMNLYFKERWIDKYYLCLVCGNFSREFDNYNKGVENFDEDCGMQDIQLKSNAFEEKSKTVKSNNPEKYFLVSDGNFLKDTKHNTVKVNVSTKKVLSLDEMKTNNTNHDSIYIKTAFRPIEHVSFKGHDYTLLEVKLFTGKSHQIRAHLRALGYPVVGDSKYGMKSEYNFLKKEIKINSQFLHAYRLEFSSDEFVDEAYRGAGFKAELFKNRKDILRKLGFSGVD
ncbi:MAG: RluA family pseudouridine synthase, partial [Lachnospiraceae bacterium]|nr:RluA family pseudouridine synthase [Lachnospiraceae bacterium]